MPGKPYVLDLPVPMLERGFWLYVWRIKSKQGEFLYVGMTGDAGFTKAADPFSRTAQHLSHNERQNAVRKNLKDHDVLPEECDSIKLIAHGPIFPETSSRDEHKRRWNIVARFRKELADALKFNDYQLLPYPGSTQDLDYDRWKGVRKAFERHFPELSCDQ